MNNYSILEMLAFFSRFRTMNQPEWRTAYTLQIQRVRSCHSKEDGGVRRSFNSLETKSGQMVDLIFDEEELIWSLEPSVFYPVHEVDRVLALVKRHKHLPSRAHRIISYRFEIIPKQSMERAVGGMELPVTHRVQPYRFQSGKISSTQVTDIVTRHLENVMVTKHLHCVVKTYQHRFYHLVYVLDQMDWRVLQEVDEEYFFVR